MNHQHNEHQNEPAPMLPPGSSGAVSVGDGTGGWAEIGTLSGPVIGLDYGQPDARHVVVWPRKYGKRLLLETEFTTEPVSNRFIDFIERMYAETRARQDRRLARLARELGLWPAAVRHQYNAVVRVLEATGHADGYGNLTIPQPARPPVLPPAVPELVPVYTDPFAQPARPPGARPPLILCSWKPRPRNAP
ncbi:hypothetical protein [Streptomyces antibioticus]|uniref:hypothetical protein n=1 Tax=Streptomyces antibioticus TaxID=1890 RepID=UPI0036FF3C8D